MNVWVATAFFYPWTTLVLPAVSMMILSILFFRSSWAVGNGRIVSVGGAVALAALVAAALSVPLNLIFVNVFGVIIAGLVGAIFIVSMAIILTAVSLFMPKNEAKNG